MLMATLFAAAACTRQTGAAPTSTPAGLALNTDGTPSEPLASPLDPFAGAPSSIAFEDRAAGFRLEHPPEWTVTGSQGSEIAIEFPASIGDPLGLRAGLYMVGFRLEEVGLFTLEELFDSFGASLAEQVLVDPPADIELDGVKGYQAPFLDLSIQGQGRLLTFIKDERGYVIIALVQPAVHYETFQPVFAAMLASLEFMPPAQQP
jgi:hypothetical protein